MHYNEAYDLLSRDGCRPNLSIRSGKPVELLVWDKMYNRMTHFAKIDHNGMIDDDMAQELLDDHDDFDFGDDYHDYE